MYSITIRFLSFLHIIRFVFNVVAAVDADGVAVLIVFGIAWRARLIFIGFVFFNSLTMITVGSFIS